MTHQFKNAALNGTKTSRLFVAHQQQASFGLAVSLWWPFLAVFFFYYVVVFTAE